MMDRDVWGKAAYTAYGDSVNWKNFQGNPMPAWDGLTDAIREAWRCSASAIRAAARSNQFAVVCLGDQVDEPVAKWDTLEAAVESANDHYSRAIPDGTLFWFAVVTQPEAIILYRTPVIESV